MPSKVQKTIHTSRTMMLAELSRIMAHGIEQGSFEVSFADNVAGKLSKANKDKTNKALRKVYSFDPSDPAFAAFLWFWKNSPEADHPILALLFAISNDFLLSESIEIVQNTPLNQKVTVESLEDNLARLHPGRYSTVTLRSISKNLASSWKQAGFILGKVKNIRVQPEISYRVVTFGMLLGYLEGMRGEFLLASKYIRALCLPESGARDLIGEAARRDLLQYQYSGHVTTILFPNLLKSIGIDGE